jgi:hypothetical protein
MVLDPTAVKFIRTGLSSIRSSSSALLPGRATNTWGMGTSADDVPALSTLGRVVRTLGFAADALPLEMVRAY